MSSLDALSQRLQELGRSRPSTPREAEGRVQEAEVVAAGGGAPSEGKPSKATAADTAEEEEEEEDKQQQPGGASELLEGLAGSATLEETSRLCQLLLEQRDHLQQLLDQDAGAAGNLLGAILAGQETKALELISKARPDQLAAMRDGSGKTPLHLAVRLQKVELAWALRQRPCRLDHVPGPPAALLDGSHAAGRLAECA